ncbi:MAG: RIP metalloprotease RseP [bacterium]
MLLTGLSFIVVLGVVVFVHEFGHFIAARLMGARVEAFSIGFGKLFGVRRGETEYRIGYIPLGGYVKISGMVDEFMEGDAGVKGEPWEFQSKSTLAKVFMITAGVLMNFIAGFLLYSLVIFSEGEPRILPTPTVGNVAKGYPAEEIGLQPGDRILSVDGIATGEWEPFRDYVQARPEQTIQLVWLHGGDTLSTAVVPKGVEVDRDGEKTTIGLIGIDQAYEHVPVGIGRSLVVGGETTWDIISLSLKSVGMLITGKASVKDLTGPAGIIYLSGETVRAGWVTFIAFIALINISIGLLNILPFPVLDGGHLVYILIEAIIRRPISTKVKLALQQVGLALLLVLVVVVTYHDILRFFVS